MHVKHELQLGKIAYSKPGDYFRFAPPKPGVSYRFTIGPAHGRAAIFVWDKDVGSVVLARSISGDDHLDFNPGQDECVITVLGCRTAYQFVVTRTPHPVWAWIKSFFGA